MDAERSESRIAEPTYDPALLETLSCEIGARPAAAPHFGDIAPALRGVSRTEGALLADFDVQVADTLAAIVDAERQCCPDLGWFLEKPASTGATDYVRLRIEGTPDQLDALAAMFTPSSAP